ncbi:GNAT family N-acetyltransferase [Caulobacter segnis]|uniref:GNAT family N-acetyltransferase n=1 Tax=Caulobacter segnis TaxID=88688 RepID=UPI001CBB5458|nr:GNAT family N-acetyltransferase [Caulobacter segnis]UAL12838.1 GNAT family N-acetyltransferase [Caulobacter segnis]
MILETERLTLAPLTVDDTPLIYPFLSDAEVMSNLDQEPIEDPDEVASRVAAQVDEMAAGDAAYWTIRHTKSGAFLGYCEFIDIDRRHDRAEIRFVIDRKGWGKGFGTEAVSALLAHGAGGGLKSLVASTHIGDNRAERLLQKLGFKAEGYLKGAVHRDGERRDRRLYGLVL